MTQEVIFDKVCSQHVKHVLQGFNACIFAFGMTSAGKTYSVVGDQTLSFKTRGIASRALDELFQHTESVPGTCFELTMSCFEVENERLVDLLSQDGPAPVIQEVDGVVRMKNLQEVRIHNVSEGLELLFTA